jgi:CMP-N,N'-diacetyllegionaminic acid synthase
MKILITICARGGSKGIPGKNIKLLNGIHLIAYTIQVAKRFSELYCADILLSTDDDEIK